MIASFTFFAHLTIFLCKNTSNKFYDKEKLHISLFNVHIKRVLVNKI